jgi:hypothetical protein
VSAFRNLSKSSEVFSDSSEEAENSVSRTQPPQLIVVLSEPDVPAIVSLVQWARAKAPIRNLWVFVRKPTQVGMYVMAVS